MKNPIELLLGLEVLFQNGISIYFKGPYYRIKIHNKEFLKIKITPLESTAIKDLISKTSECRCSLEWIYLSLDKINIKEGVSTEDL